MVQHLEGKKWRANSNMDRALSAARKAKSIELMTQISYRTAYIFCRQGKWDKAQPHAERAKKGYTQLKDPKSLDRTEKMLIEINKNKGKSTGFFG